MKVNLSRADNIVIVDGEARPVDLSGLSPQIESVTFNTVTEEGLIQYTDDTHVNVEERDLDAERTENQRRLASNQLPLETPIYRTLSVRRPVDRFTDFTPFMPYFDAWAAYVSPPPTPPTAEELAQRQINQDATNDLQTVSFGTTVPATVAELKHMTRVEFGAWFGQNYDTAAKLVPLIRRMLFILIRRVF